MGSLSSLYISQSYQSLTHLGTNNALSAGTMTQLQDGIGQSLNISFDGTNISSSGNIYAANLTGSGASINTGSFVTTSSFNSYTQSTNIRLNNLETTSASVNVSISNLNSTTASQGVSITNLNVTSASLKTSASLALVTASVNLNTITFTKGNGTTFAITVNTGSGGGGSTDTGSLMVTGSITGNILTFTKGDASTFNLTIPSATGSVFDTGSFATTGSNSFNGNQEISGSVTITGSLIVNYDTLSSPQLVIDKNTYEVTLRKIQGAQPMLIENASTSNLQITTTPFDDSYKVLVNNNEFYYDASTSLNQLQKTQINGKLIVTGEITASLQEGYAWVGNSGNTSSLVSTSSFGGSTNTGSFMLTGSVSGNVLTFTKGDASTFSLTVATGSGGGTIDTGSFTTTSSFNAYTQSNDAKVNSLISATGSYATTGSNTFNGNQTINGNVNITGSLTASGLFYPTTAGTAGQFMTTNGTNTLSFDDVHVLLEDVRYGENITLGDPLYVSGSNGTRPVVFKADASNSAKMPVIYVANSTAVANTNTTALTLGLITGVTTTGYPEGTTIYVAEGTAGWSASRPSGSASIVQSLGIVTKEGPGGSGRGLVLNPGPATLPNLQTGYIWAGNGANQPVAVATSSFIDNQVTSASFNSFTSSINSFTASQYVSNSFFATTGSNSFTGIQTFVDGTNFSSLVSTSGSLMLVAKSFTSASLHLSSSFTNSVNLIFKNNNNTGDTIISGSNNLFVNATAPTAGFKRYLGGSGNIALNASNVPLISGSMAFSPTMNNNYFGGNSTTLTMRGPVSASTYTISSNMLIGAMNIGSSVVNNAEKILGSLTIASNQLGQGLNIIANRTAISASVGVSNNAVIGGTTTLSMASSSINYAQNVGNATITNGFQNAGATTGNNNLTVAQNWFGAAIINVSGSDAGGLANPRYLSNNYIFGGFNLLGTPNANLSLNGSGSSMLSTIAMGQDLGITGSNGYDSNNGILTPGIGAGSAFFGRWNSQSGNRARTAETVFAIGTGTETTRKTGFLIDSGSNTFVEGTFNVSGSTSLTGSLNVSGSTSLIGTLNTTGTFTASLANGYAWVGNSSNVSAVVATSSFGGTTPAGTVSSSAQILNYGIFATTGSNTFTGNQIISASLSIRGNTTFTSVSGITNNVILGSNAAANSIGLAQSIAIGQDAMQFSSGSTGNIAIGIGALKITSGSSNFGLGTFALTNNTSGETNIAIGTGAGYNNATGNRNIFIGFDAGSNIITGSSNTFIGAEAGADAISSSNTIIGRIRGDASLESTIIIAAGTVQKLRHQNDIFQVTGSVAASQGLSALGEFKLSTSTNKPMGIVSVNSSLTVTNSLVTNSSIILVTTQNGSVGGIEYAAVVMNKGTGTFDIVHDYGGTLDVAYLIINPA
jgi:hypothetical protein